MGTELHTDSVLIQCHYKTIDSTENAKIVAITGIQP